MWIQTSTTNLSVWLWLKIRGEATLLTRMVCVVSLPAFRFACVSWTLCCVCELSWGCFSTPWKLKPGRSECCLYSSISSSSHKVLHGSVCYYRDVLPNCPLNLYILILFAWGRGLLTCQGFLVREGEWQGVGWCEVGPKAAASPLLEMLLRGHSANSPQLWVTFCQTQTWYCCKPQHEWEVKNIATTNFVYFRSWESLEPLRIEQQDCFLLLSKLFVALQSMLKMSEHHIHQSWFCLASSSSALFIILLRMHCFGFLRENPVHVIVCSQMSCALID